MQSRSATLALMAATVAAAAPQAATAARKPDAVGAAARATVTFGLNLMRKLPAGNLVFSPDSIEASLAMVGEGASGQTASQIATVLGLPSASDFGQAGALQRRLLALQTATRGAESTAPVLDIADALFLQRGFSIEPGFISDLRQGFDAPPRTLDFAHDPQPATAAINRWAEDHTHGLIKKALPELSNSTRLVLANAIYLKSSWMHAFPEGNTHPNTFHTERGDVSTPFMQEWAELGYRSGRGWALVQLPYANSDLAMDIVLPEGQSVGRLLSHINPEMLEKMVTNLPKREVELELPRFHTALAKDLVSPLRALGMTDSFGAAANFSRISRTTHLAVGLVQHDAYISVDEAGTEAAAFTGSSVHILLVGPERMRARFDANRPFLFFLRETRTGAILFAGRVANPASG